MEKEITYSPGPVCQETGFYGVRFDFNYGARVLVPEGEELHVRITDMDTDCVLYDINAQNAIVSSQKKYFINYCIDVWHGEEHFHHELNLENKRVMVVCPSRAIGDVLAWIPYVEEFRKVHNCELNILVGNHIRELLRNNFPKLNFVDGRSENDQYYATYYIGVFFPVTDRDYQPMDFRFLGLQKNVAAILGLPLVELQTRLKASEKRIIEEPYVCIAVQATTQCKTWNNRGGWINLIEYLKKKGYRVLCIDKDKVYGDGRFVNTIPYGCEDFTGNIPLQERVDILAHADFFVGGSSGLAWLAWASGTPVVMIGGFTLPFNEFSNPYRVINFHTCTACWHESEFKNDDYGWCPRHKGTDKEFECSRLISASQVIRTIECLMRDRQLNRE